jgi:hypothetical protein
MNRCRLHWLLAAVIAASAGRASAQSPAPGTAAPSAPGTEAAAPHPPPSPPAPCAAPEARQFDFWVGEWIATWKTPVGTIGQGTNRVESILGGCAISENFESSGARPLVGKSYSVWSPRLKKWQQTWVDNGGAYLDLAGEFTDGRMVLVRDGILGNGKPGKQRMIYSHITRDRFEWDWESSEDGGITWTRRWHIDYARK